MRSSEPFKHAGAHALPAGHHLHRRAAERAKAAERIAAMVQIRPAGTSAGSPRSRWAYVLATALAVAGIVGAVVRIWGR